MKFSFLTSLFIFSMAIASRATPIGCVPGTEPKDGRQAEAPENFLEGYIVTSDRDTLKGWILLRDHIFNSRQCVFKRTVDASPETYTPDQCLAYNVPGQKYFLSAELSGEFGGNVTRRAFLECIVNSRLSLFFLKDHYFIKTPDRIEELMVKKDEVREGTKAYVIRQPLYKFILRKEMASCLKIDEYLVKTELNVKSLKQLFTNYLECAGAGFEVYGSQHETLKIQISLVPGIQATSLTLQSEGSAEYQFADNGSTDWKMSFVASAFVEFYRKEMPGRPRLKTGITLYNNNFELNKDNPAANLRYKLNIECTRIEVPILVKYCLGRKSTSFYVQGGIGLNGKIKWKDRLVVIVPPSYVLREASDLKPNGLSANILAAAGLAFSMGSRDFLIDLSYGRNPLVLQGRSNSPQAAIRSFVIGAGMKL